MSNKIDSKILILFWQFAIKTLDELDVVSNQNLSLEMFLMRLMYLHSQNIHKDPLKKENFKNLTEENFEIKKEHDLKADTINQIKNVTQEKKVKVENQAEIKAENELLIKSFEKLLNVCNDKKEMKLKYELEKNVNLVSFEKNRIEISFNDNLDKNFVKNLSTKLFEWTGERWIISFSKEKGQESIREKEKNKKDKILKETKQMDIYKSVLNKFPDANLIDVITKIKDEN